MAAKSVFISHSSKDDAIVRGLRQALENLGIETWVDSEQLTGGDPLRPEIETAIERADYFLVFVSLDALNSEWVNREIEHAQKLKKKIVPIARPGIGAPILRRVFGEEPVAIYLGEGPAAVGDALPKILEAIGVQKPTETVKRVQVQLAPAADLILELNDPRFDESDGKRRAAATATLTYCPADGTPKVESGRYPFVAPLGPIEAGEIEWYLERYINWPSGLFQERAQRTIDALPEWGRLLYKTMNGDTARNALAPWTLAAASERRFSVKVDKQLIAGAPADKQKEAGEAATLLLALPWELLHDGESYLFQGLHGVRVRRSIPNSKPRSALATEPPIRVLLLSPRPEDDAATYIDHRTSARPLVEALSELGDLAQFQLLDPPTFPALEAELVRAAEAKEPYHVVHFDGHGIYDKFHGLGQLCFEDPADRDKLERRRSQLIDAEKIASLVRDHRVPLFFLEACQTAQAGKDPSASVAARLLESGVASVAAMSHSVLVETARRFVTEFYKELLSGHRVGQAMLAGQRALQSDTFRGKTFSGELHLEDWFVPVLFQGEEDPQLIREVPAKQVEAVIEKRRDLALGELPDPPGHQFLGRSRDLLMGERILARERYLVVQGSGGEGKTTFAAELARWLVLTRRFKRAAFTSVEQVTEARQVLFSIGAQLVSNFAGRVGTDEELGRQLIERAMAEYPTLLVIDNMESILDHASLGEILKLCNGFQKARLIFTTREAMPAPFADHVLRIGRLDRDTAIRLVGNLLQDAPDSGETQQDLENLVDAVGGHARSLVLIAREVGAAGVRRATENLQEVMRDINAKHPDERENSLLASAELSLRRLPAEVRELIRPLSVFQGGGSFFTIALALELDPGGVGTLAHALIGVGLAEYVEPGYLRFDPALVGGDLTPEEREAARTAWAEASSAALEFLYRQQFKDANLAASLALLELPNLMAALVHLAKTESAERVVSLAIELEQLISPVNRPEVLARVVEIRTAAAQHLAEWSHAQYLAGRAAIDRFLEQGRHGDAVRAAQALHLKAEAAGDAAYEGAAYDGAMAQWSLGRALQMSGNAGSALPHVDAGRQRFERLNAPRMAGVALTDKADCLTDLGRYEEAAGAYEEAIAIHDQLEDPRSVGVNQLQLARIRRAQKDYPEAHRIYDEALKIFEGLNEPASVATAWHQIAIVYQEAGQYEAAEQAYQKSLNIKVQIGNRSGQASTLNQLGNLYSTMGRTEEAVRLYRQAPDIYVSTGDLRNEGLGRSNLADQLIKLRRYDEARLELNRAIECKRAFGHVAQPWKTFDILSDLERAVGNQPAALAARNQAMAAYLAYRRDGGASEIDDSQIAALVNQDPTTARATLDDPELDLRVAAEILLALETLDTMHNKGE